MRGRCSSREKPFKFSKTSSTTEVTATRVSVADHGEMAYQTSAALPRSTLAWFNRAGRARNHRALFRTRRSPRSSWMGSVWPLPVDGTSRDIWLIDLERGNSRVTTASGDLMPCGHRMETPSLRIEPRRPVESLSDGVERHRPRRIAGQIETVKHPATGRSTERSLCMIVCIARRRVGISGRRPYAVVEARRGSCSTESAEGHGRRSSGTAMDGLHDFRRVRDERGPTSDPSAIERQVEILWLLAEP